MPRVIDLGITIGLLPPGPTGSVLNSLLQAETVSGRDGNTSFRLPADELRRVLA